jgi:hypothetical protein
VFDAPATSSERKSPLLSATDTQIQSPIERIPVQQDQQLASAECGEVRQNPQHRRKEEDEIYLEEQTLP